VVLIQIVRWESMDFARQASAAVILVALTLWCQCGGLAVLIHWVRGFAARGVRGLNDWRIALLIVRLTTVIIALHLLQILLWTAFYRWQCLPSWETSFYFSATSYSTVGYGDIVLPRVWRALGPIEGMTGVLMCGISVSVLFAIAARLVADEDTVDLKVSQGLKRSG
jgi:voltage-gated potassium channel